MTNDSPLAQGNRYCGAAPGDPYLRCCARPARGAPGARRHRCLLRRVVYWAGEASTAVTRPGRGPSARSPHSRISRITAQRRRDLSSVVTCTQRPGEAHWRRCRPAPAAGRGPAPGPKRDSE